MTNGKNLSCTLIASLKGNDNIDARSTVIISIVNDWKICCFCLISIFLYFCLCKCINECPHVTKLAKFKLPSCSTSMFWNTLCRI